ncbi:metallophosphoesterase family protein [Solibacillus sp. FSL K6-1554]|uniref:metallophosphoesterase family protein n=1 Tax=Solibacillus sp. FSL K6-1554 TaxID=2921472 RepID=UPI0030FA0009
MKIFVISDIHGMYKQFEQLLTFWDRESKLVLLGDLVDRGPQSLDVVKKAMELKINYGEQIVFCKGNHEVMLLDFLRFPEMHCKFYIPNGGRETIQSFMEDAPGAVKELNIIEQAYYMKEQFADEFSFLESGKLYEIVGEVLLTHAGFESYYAEVSESTDDDFLWMRDHYLHPNKTPYVNVFGHTPTKKIHKIDDIWLSADKKYIGIDGGCAYGGQLNAVLLSNKGEIIETFSVKG